MKALKKSLAMLLALVMSLGCMSVGVWADDEEPTYTWDFSISDSDYRGGITTLSIGTESIVAGFLNFDSENLTVTDAVSSDASIAQLVDVEGTQDVFDEDYENIIGQETYTSPAWDELGNLNIKGVSAGTAYITQTLSDGSEARLVVVVDEASYISATSVTFSDGEYSGTLKVGETKQLTAIVNPENATFKDVVWTSSDEGVATVSSVGLITAVAAGTATIKATYAYTNPHNASYGLTVVAPVAQIDTTPYYTLAEAITAAASMSGTEDNPTVIQLLAGTIKEDTVKFPATVKNVKIRGAAGKATTLENTLLTSADGSSVDYENISFDGIVFDNSRILFTGSRSSVTYKDWSITNCEFRNITADSNYAAVHIGTLNPGETMNGFTFSGNVIGGVSGSSNSGLLCNRVSGTVTITDNVIKEVKQNAIQMLNSTADAKITISGNILGSDADEGVVNLYGGSPANISVTYNVFNLDENQPAIAYLSGVDVSGNYWGGSAPSETALGNSDYKSVYSSYYNATSSETEAGFTLSNKVYSEEFATNAVAQIGNDYYASLADAIAAVPADGTQTTITMVGNETINSNTGVTIAAGKNVVLDLNGWTISQTAPDAAVSYLVKNNGTLTIKDSTDTAEDGTGTGKMYSEALQPSSSYKYATNLISNYGTLIVESGYLESHTRYASYVIDNYSGGDATVNGGHLYNCFTSAIRLFCNSTTQNDTVTINGGIIDGYCAIWMQNPNSNANKGSLTINGGTFKTTEKAVVNGEKTIVEGYSALYTDSSDNMSLTITNGTFNTNVETWGKCTASITGGTFNGYVYSEEQTGFISGGTFAVKPDDTYVATGYCAVKSNANGTLNPEGDHWTVVKAYTVKFVNWDGKVLQSGFVARGAVPSYSGTPTRTATTTNTYTFSGWNDGTTTYAVDASLPVATGNATYTARFDPLPVASNVIVSVDNTTTPGTTVVTVTDASNNGTKTTTTETTSTGALNIETATEMATVETLSNNATTSATVEKTVKETSTADNAEVSGDTTYTYTVKTASATQSTASGAVSEVDTKLATNPDTSTKVTLKAEKVNAVVDTKSETVQNKALETALTTGANIEAKANVITTAQVKDSTLSKKMTDLAAAEEITGKAVTVEVALTLETKLTDYAVESGEATTVTFDVKPMLTTTVEIDGVQQGESTPEPVSNTDLVATDDAPITVKLPIPANFVPEGYAEGTTTLQIKHMDDSGNLKGYIPGTIKGNSTNRYYVEFTVTEFSSFEIVPAGKVFVTFDANGGNAVAGRSVTANSTIGDLPTSTRSGSWRFDGWFTAANGGTQINSATTVSESTTYYAHWTDTTPTYYGGDDDGYTPSAPQPTTTITDEETPLSEFPIFYVDVADDSWYHDAIAYVTALDLMNGVGDDRFDPNADTTRGMVAVVMMRLASGEAVDLDSFFDVADDAYYAEAAAWAVENGVFKGYDDGSFRGEINITREQFAAVLYRYAIAMGYDVSEKADLGDYDDGTLVSGYASEAMAWAVESGIIQGIGSSKLDPTGNATRAQLATMLMRFHALYTAEV